VSLLLIIVIMYRPIPLLWNLQLNTNAKISVGFLLSLGVLASLSACIRLRYTVNLTHTDDYLFSVGDVVIWGCEYLPSRHTSARPACVAFTNLQLCIQTPKTV
jgi:hypothetical protein